VLKVKRKNPHAVALGRLGGKAGTGKAKARTSEQARRAIMTRWSRCGDNSHIKTEAYQDARG